VNLIQNHFNLIWRTVNPTRNHFNLILRTVNLIVDR
jgi:hypothetical protein